MTETIFDKILAAKRRRVEALYKAADFDALKTTATEVRGRIRSHRLRSALEIAERINIIAEIKRASPSKGVINADVDVAETALRYRDGGAAAISVLTEEDLFEGSLDDLRIVRSTVDLPILRKDFVVDEFQIYETAAAGADIMLLIVAALTEDELNSFLRIGRDELGMDVIVEVHTGEELDTAIAIGADIIGVNNRNLKTFDVSLETSRRLIAKRPGGALMITESGLSTRDEITELKGLGYDGFLIGESLMRTANAANTLKNWI